MESKSDLLFFRLTNDTKEYPVCFSLFVRYDDDNVMVVPADTHTHTSHNHKPPDSNSLQPPDHPDRTTERLEPIGE